MAFAENTEESAVFTLEDAFDAGVVGCREPSGVETVAGGEAVVHALAHRFVLRGHQTRRLRAGQAQGILQLGRRQLAQFARSHRRRVGAEYRAGVPATVEHLRAVQRVADARADFEADDRGKEKVRAGGGSRLRGHGRQQCGNDQRTTVYRRDGVKVVELEALNEGPVEHSRGRSAGGFPGADDHGVAAVLELEDGVGGHPRPGQLRADQAAAQTVEEQVFGAFDDALGNVVKGQAGDPSGQSSGRPVRVGGGVLVNGGHGHRWSCIRRGCRVV